MSATKQELRREIADLRSVGAMMSNICFNLSQSETRVPNKNDRDCMDDLRVKWDAIARAEGK